MYEASYAEPQCSICIDNLFEHPVCALRCGHCYHASCFEEWRIKAKNECPQCKAKADGELRILKFATREDCDQTSLEDVRRLMNFSSAERVDMLQKLEEQVLEVSGQLDKARLDEAELWENARHRKQRRKDLEKELPVQEQEITDVQAELAKMQESVAQLQLHVDEETQRQRVSLPVPLARDGDTDLAEERRRLRGVRREERLKQLHEALVNALAQEQETLAEVRERAAESKRWEAESAEMRRKVAKLKQDLQERRAVDAKQASARRLRSQGSHASLTSSASAASDSMIHSILALETDGAAASAAAQLKRARSGGDGQPQEASTARGTVAAALAAAAAAEGPLGAASMAGRSSAPTALVASASGAASVAGHDRPPAAHAVAVTGASGVLGHSSNAAAMAQLSSTSDLATKPPKPALLPQQAADDSLYSRPLMRKRTANLGALFSGSSTSCSVAALPGGSTAPVAGKTTGSLRTLLSER